MGGDASRQAGALTPRPEAAGYEYSIFIPAEEYLACWLGVRDRQLVVVGR